MTDISMIGPIPQIGFGTWNRDGDAAYQGVIDALEIGYRHIDTAEGYNNEEFVGKALVESGLNRADYFLTTKIAPESFAPGQMMGHAETSLEKLRTDQVDLLLLHYPSIGDEYDIEDYMAQFAEIFDKGLTKAIGVSNFTIRHLDRAFEILGERKLITNQVEAHVFMQNRKIIDYSKAKGLSATAFSPLARGAVIGHDVIGEIAKKQGATDAQIALAFLMHEGHIVIPSAGAKTRIAENFGAVNVKLDAEDMNRLRALEEGRRLINGPWCPEWD